MGGGHYPDFVIIGAMKSATSTLHSQLAAQPGFLMSTPKEPNFFSDVAEWNKGLDWYRNLFDDARPGDLKGESSTHYTKLPDLPDALPRIARHLPEARFIYVMRHPVDRLVSHYIHGWTERTIAGPIDEAIDLYPALVNYGRYAMQIAPWLDHFGTERVLPVFFERLLGEPQAELERVCSFLGYNGTPTWREGMRDNESAARMRISPLRDAIVDHPLVALVRRNLIPQAVRNRIKGQWQMRDKPVLGDAARAAVEARFDADLAKLGSMFGTPLSCATFKETVRGQSLDWVGA